MKIKGKILPVILKGIGAVILWCVGFYIISNPSISFPSVEAVEIVVIIGVLICGLILRGNSWRETLTSWVISVIFATLVIFPLMTGFPHSFVDKFYLSLMLGFEMAYSIPTFISTLIVMSIYKFIQKKRAEKRFKEVDTSDNN